MLSMPLIDHAGAEEGLILMMLPDDEGSERKESKQTIKTSRRLDGFERNSDCALAPHPFLHR